MDQIKQTHNDFISDFKSKLAARRDEFYALGIDTDNEDIGATLHSLMEHAWDNPTDETITPFVRANYAMIGDLYWNTPFAKAKHPLTFTFSYKGHAVGMKAFGTEVYSDVYGQICGTAKGFADSFLPGSRTLNAYLDGDNDARNQLLAELDFQKARNWTIIWAKLDWIRYAFPKSYAKMMEDGEFMTVEEAETKMKEMGS
jgi:hypothetical protein